MAKKPKLECDAIPCENEALYRVYKGPAETASRVSLVCYDHIAGACQYGGFPATVERIGID